MDWIFQEAYKVFQKILDGTVTSQQLIPLFSIIILFGALLGRRHISHFIQYCINQAKTFSKAKGYEAEVLIARAEVRRNIEQIKQHLIDVKGKRQKFTTQYNGVCFNVEQLSTSKPINHTHKEHIKSQLFDLNDCYQKSVEDFQAIEQLLEAIAEIERAEELRENAIPIANSALEEARARQSQVESTKADVQTQHNSWPPSKS